ncbi:MAG: CDP-alcohol phosphatidyltransferase family protein [Rhodobacter sp.]|nr:CDP-alcohol phosphatidyltransferase family protein [Rhodobacter sp.]
MTSQNRIAWTEIAYDACGERMRVEIRSSWAIALLARGPSVPVTWLLARAGVAPMTVTLAGLALALSMPAQALLLPLSIAVWGVALSGWLFQVLDCVDGSLARLNRVTTRRGGDMDFLVDMAQWGLLYLSIGVLADRTLDMAWLWTAVAGIAAWGRLLARVIRDRLDDADPAPLIPLRAADVPVAFLAGISGLIPFAALTGGWLGVAVIALLIYSLLDIVEAALPLTRGP